jgi:hypothetical protein
MKSHFAETVLVSIALISSFQYCYADLPEIESRSNLSCMMGGVGLSESQSMREEAKKWPLAIEFSEHIGKSDAWISGAQLTIANKDGNIIFDEPCNGPIFLAKLAPGRYLLTASYQGVIKKKTIEVQEGKSLKESFNWKSK